MINVLKYLHGLDSFKEHKPWIFMSSNDMYQDYYDYWATNDGLFILCSKGAQAMGKAYYALDFIRPESIVAIFNPENKDVDASKVSGSSSVNVSDSKIKNILQDLATGKDNENISFNGSIITIDDGEIAYITEKTKFGNSVFSITEPVIDNSLMVGHLGEPVTVNKNVFIPYNKVNVISVPLQYVNYSPFKSMINGEIKEAVETYLKNLYGEFMVEPHREFKIYNRGERVVFRYKEEYSNGVLSDFKFKYFISKIDGNDTLPMSKKAKEREAWVEYTK